MGEVGQDGTSPLSMLKSIEWKMKIYCKVVVVNPFRISNRKLFP